MYRNHFSRPPAWRHTRPSALAWIRGSSDYPAIRGVVRFYQTDFGVLVDARIKGLPAPDTVCESPVFGFHLHEGTRCAPTADDPFGQAGSHYNPHNCPHPYHAGDFPPLFGAHGFAFTVFLTDRFTTAEVIGKTLIIHAAPDDFTTQPAGNAGARIACGRIVVPRF